MQFTIETTYNLQNLTTMARALRKTVRKKHSCRAHIFGWALVILGGCLCVVPLLDGSGITGSSVATGIAVLVMLVALLWEDRLNGYFARKRLLPGTEEVVAEFHADTYQTTTQVGKTEWRYDALLLIAEAPDAFVFIFDKMHAQIYAKHGLQGGSVEDFRHFLEEATGKPVVAIH